MHTVANSSKASAGKLVITIAAFVALGIPLIAFIWETANRGFAGHFEAKRVLLTLPAILLLLGLFTLLARTLTAWEGERK